MRIDAGLFVGKQGWSYCSVWSIRNKKDSIWMNEGDSLGLYSVTPSVYSFLGMERICFILQRGVEEEACLILIGCAEYTQDTTLQKIVFFGICACHTPISIFLRATKMDNGRYSPSGWLTPFSFLS